MARELRRAAARGASRRFDGGSPLELQLDLQAEAGMDVFRRLLAHADFVAENFSPRVLGNLGIDYEAMQVIKPDIILCSLSAYGHDGPWANVPGCA